MLYMQLRCCSAGDRRRHGGAGWAGAGRLPGPLQGDRGHRWPPRLRQKPGQTRSLLTKLMYIFVAVYHPLLGFTLL